MNYTLMHKNYPVVDINIDSDTATISKIGDVFDHRRLPLGTFIVSNRGRGELNRGLLNEWWTNRSIPASRSGLKDVLVNLNIGSPTRLLEKCFGLSLSDQYWISPKNSDLKWENVNFFDNEFSKDMGDILFGRVPRSIKKLNLMSPDNTSDGWLRKKWIIVDSKRYLMKGGSGFFQQEPFNEVVASSIMHRLGINHVTYTLTKDDNKPYSLCENFVTSDTELVTAWRLLQTQKRPNDRSKINHLLHCCETFAVQSVKLALNQMLTLDYIIANEDRHLNNFGFIRNVNTLDWMGFAPIFDSGTSLWYDKHVGINVDCKPFRNDHSKQIKLVDDLEWFDPRKLYGLDEEIVDIYESSENVDQQRVSEITKSIKGRIRRIEKMQEKLQNQLKRE